MRERIKSPQLYRLSYRPASGTETPGLRCTTGVPGVALRIAPPVYHGGASPALLGLSGRALESLARLRFLTAVRFHILAREARA